MKIIRAQEMGMCFGVKDALQITKTITNPQQVTIHGELVHNPEINRQLAAAGFHQSPENNRETSTQTPLVLITAHGVSNTEKQRLKAADKKLIDTTCPLVRRVHETALELQAEGRHILLLGQPGHVEVQGIIEDLNSYHVIHNHHDVRPFQKRLLGIICQTTMPPKIVTEICALIRLCNPFSDIRFVDTICEPTKLRQQAMLELVKKVEVMVVIGGHNSNNTRQLVQLCREHHLRAFHIESAAELKPEWFENVNIVGLTAGTSTLEETINDVLQTLEQISLNDNKEKTADAKTMDT